MRASASDQGDLFDGGPPLRLQRVLRIARSAEHRTGRRAVLVALVAWLPLPLLALAEGGPARGSAFFADIAVHARLLIAAPLMVLAEAICIPQLGRIAGHFLKSGVVPPSERGRFDAAAASTRRLLDSRLAEAAAFALAYIVIAALIVLVPPANVPAWHRTDAGRLAAFSLAGWWHVLVSLPLLIVLFHGWMWRLFLWTRLLWRISKLDLQLVPAHPDGAAGLGFVGLSARAFSILGMSFGAVVAGRVAERVAHHGEIPKESLWFLIGLLVIVAILFAGPLLFFGRRLLRAWRRGIFEYGALAGAVGYEFERKWLASRIDKDALEASDFSATTDLYQITANVSRIRFVPIDLTSIIVLFGATLFPFIPAMLLILPFRAIIDEIGKLLF